MGSKSQEGSSLTLREEKGSKAAGGVAATDRTDYNDSNELKEHWCGASSYMSRHTQLLPSHLAGDERKEKELRVWSLLIKVSTAKFRLRRHTRYCLEAVASGKALPGVASLFVLRLGDPHVLNGWKRRQDGATNPRRCLALRGGIGSDFFSDDVMELLV